MQQLIEPDPLSKKQPREDSLSKRAEVIAELVDNDGVADDVVTIPLSSRKH